MKGVCAAVALVCLVGCSSFTTGPNAPWGPINGVNFVPADAFFLESVQTNGDYNFVLIVADRTGYCPILQQNLAGFPSNITYAFFTFSNARGTGPHDPLPGTYPITDRIGPTPTAQASYGTVSNCVPSPTLAGTTGSVVMWSLDPNVTAMTGSVNVGFAADAGTLIGDFAAPLCNTANAAAGPSRCFP